MVGRASFMGREWRVSGGRGAGVGRGGLGGGAAPRDWHVVAVALTYPRVDCNVSL